MAERNDTSKNSRKARATATQPIRNPSDYTSFFIAADEYKDSYAQRLENQRLAEEAADETAEMDEGAETPEVVEGATPLEEVKAPEQPKQPYRPKSTPKGTQRSAGRPPKDPTEELSKKARLTSAAVASALAFYRNGIRQKVTSDDELIKRIDKFFDSCAAEGQLPTFEKLCLSLGYTKSEVTAWETGTSRGFSSRTGEIIRQAKLALSAVEADLAMQGQIQASIYQFRSKNFSGMKDQTETIVTPNTEPISKSLAELLAASKALPLAPAAEQTAYISAEYTDEDENKGE